MLGLTHSHAGAKSLAAAGAKVHRGDVEDLDSLRSGVAVSDGVIHTAFNHDFSKFKANCEIDRRAIEALGSALAGSDRPLIITSAIGVLPPGGLATEETMPASGPTANLGQLRKRQPIQWQSVAGALRWCALGPRSTVMAITQ